MKIQLTILLLAVVFITSCKKAAVTDCFSLAGDLTTEVRSIESFNSLLLRDNVNVILKKSDSCSITVEAGSNLIAKIVTQVNDDGVLEIRNENKCNWIRSFDSPISVYLNYVDIDSIEYHSIGDITTSNKLVTDSLWIIVYEGAGKINLDIDVERIYCSLHYGTLDIIVKGECGLSYVYSASFGFINMIDLESDFVYINNRSSNNIYVKAIKHIGATIENIGDIYYAGTPETVTFNQIGTGHLIQIND